MTEQIAIIVVTAVSSFLFVYWLRHAYLLIFPAIPPTRGTSADASLSETQETPPAVTVGAGPDA